MDEPRALLPILIELAYVHPNLVLTQGTERWPIEELLWQARQDRRGAARKHLETPLYGIVTDSMEKISIINLASGRIIFSEVGAEEPAPYPE